jgi:hypothetical protein
MMEPPFVVFFPITASRAATTSENASVGDQDRNLVHTANVHT